jgi:hypothetical protein
MAYLYGDTITGWAPVLEATGTAADGPGFGGEVATSLFHLVVGAPDANGGNGRVSVFGRGGQHVLATWGLLFARDGAAGARLGEAVGADRIYSALGAPNSDKWGAGAGRVRLDRAGSYEIWAMDHEPGILPDWRPEEDADGDGQPNLVEFALGGDPLDAGSRGVFRLERGVYESGVSSDPAMIWEVPTLPYYHEFLDHHVEADDDMTSWITEEFHRDTGGAVERRFYELPPGDPERRFYRLNPHYPWFGEPDGLLGSGVIVID